MALMAAGEPYPPQEDGVGTTAEARDWLLSGDVLERWTAESDGRAVGHVSVSSAHAYLSDRLYPDAGHQLAQVNKLFVAPSHRSRGLGHMLLHAVLSWAAAQAGTILVLAVLPTSRSAVDLYLRAGLTEIGRFDGIHGTNIVFSASADLGFHEPPTGGTIDT